MPAQSQCYRWLAQSIPCPAPTARASRRPRSWRRRYGPLPSMRGCVLRSWPEWLCQFPARCGSTSREGGGLYSANYPDRTSNLPIRYILRLLVAPVADQLGKGGLIDYVGNRLIYSTPGFREGVGRTL